MAHREYSARTPEERLVIPTTKSSSPGVENPRVVSTAQHKTRRVKSPTRFGLLLLYSRMRVSKSRPTSGQILRPTDGNASFDWPIVAHDCLGDSVNTLVFYAWDGLRSVTTWAVLVRPDLATDNAAQILPSDSTILDFSSIHRPFVRAFWNTIHSAWGPSRGGHLLEFSAIFSARAPSMLEILSV